MHNVNRNKESEKISNKLSRRRNNSYGVIYYNFSIPLSKVKGTANLLLAPLAKSTIMLLVLPMFTSDIVPLPNILCVTVIPTFRIEQSKDGFVSEGFAAGFGLATGLGIACC